jgi:hypothetical protein
VALIPGGGIRIVASSAEEPQVDAAGVLGCAAGEQAVRQTSRPLLDARSSQSIMDIFTQLGSLQMEEFP